MINQLIDFMPFRVSWLIWFVHDWSASILIVLHRAFYYAILLCCKKRNVKDFMSFQSSLDVYFTGIREFLCCHSSFCFCFFFKEEFRSNRAEMGEIGPIKLWLNLKNQNDIYRIGFYNKWDRQASVWADACMVKFSVYASSFFFVHRFERYMYYVAVWWVRRIGLHVGCCLFLMISKWSCNEEKEEEWFAI